MFEFARSYPGIALGPETPWPLFMAGCVRIPRFHARAVLEASRGVQSGVGSVFGSGPDLAGDRLLRTAFPLKRAAPKMALVQGGDDAEA